MVYKILVKSKVIEITDNKSTVLQILDDVLNSHGLKADATAAAIVDLVPGQPANLGGLINALVGKAEESGMFKWGATGRLLPASAVELDEVGNHLLQEYINDWIDIEHAAGFTAKDMESYHVKSSRVLIMELFTRIVMQALRQDSKLPLDGKFNRSIWLEVLHEFSIALASKKYNLKIQKKGLDSFLIDCEKIHTRWIEWLASANARIDEIESAKTIISTNLANVRSRQLQTMRYIYVALQGREGAKKAIPGCLADRQIERQLAILQEKMKTEAMKSLSKNIEITDKKALIIKEACVTEVSLTTWLKQEEIFKQNILYHYTDDEHLAKLYGLLNWTVLIKKMLEKIDEVVNLGGWVPLLVGLMELGSVDSLLLKHQEIYKKIINSTEDPYDINDTQLRIELSQFNLQDANRDVQKLGKLSQLQNKELLGRISDRFGDAFAGIATLGCILNCSVMSGGEKFTKISSTIKSAPLLSIPAINNLGVKVIQENKHKKTFNALSGVVTFFRTDKKEQSDIELKEIQSANEIDCPDIRISRIDAAHLKQVVEEIELKFQKIETQMSSLK